MKSWIPPGEFILLNYYLKHTIFNGSCQTLTSGNTWQWTFYPKLFAPIPLFLPVKSSLDSGILFHLLTRIASNDKKWWFPFIVWCYCGNSSSRALSLAYILRLGLWPNLFIKTFPRKILYFAILLKWRGNNLLHKLERRSYEAKTFNIVSLYRLIFIVFGCCSGRSGKADGNFWPGAGLKGRAAPEKTLH